MQSSSEADLAASVVRDFEEISGKRGNWESHWEEIAERILPHTARLFTSARGESSKGSKKTELVFDSTAAIALGRFTSIVTYLLYPQNQIYHRLKSDNEHLNKDRSVNLFFEDLNSRIWKTRHAPYSGFLGENEQDSEALGAFGTTCLYSDPLRDRVGFRYRHCHLGEVYFKDNFQGITDTVFRHYPLKARQIIQKWGKERLPDKVLNAKSDDEFFVLENVRPREDVDRNKLDHRGMDWVQYDVLMEGKVLLQEKGYRSFPYAISRYRLGSRETYGRSIAMDCLPAIKTLNEEKKTVLKQGHRALDPVLLAHDDGVLDSFSMRSGYLNFGGVNKDGKALVQALPSGNIVAGKELMDDERSLIENAFFTTLFQLLIQSPAKTATQVVEEIREKGILLTPTFGRHQSEKLGRLIEREIDMLFQIGQFPEIPPVLVEAAGEYEIVHESPLNKAARVEEVAGLMRGLDMAIRVASETQNPEPLDHYNWDEVVPEVNDIFGTPLRWMNSKDKIEQIRAARKEQMDIEQAGRLSSGGSAMIKAVDQVQQNQAV